MVGVKTENCSAFSSLQSALIFQSQIMVWSPESWEWSGWKPCRQDVFRDRLHHHHHHFINCNHHGHHHRHYLYLVGNPAGRMSSGTGCIIIFIINVVLTIMIAGVIIIIAIMIVIIVIILKWLETLKAGRLPGQVA